MRSGVCIAAFFVCLMVGCKPELKKGAEDAWHQNGGVRSAVYGVALGADKQTCVKEFAKYDFQIKYDEDTLVCFQKGANHEAFMYDGRYYRYLYAYIKNQKVEAIELNGAFPYEMANVVYNKGKYHYTKHYYIYKQVDDTDANGYHTRCIMARDKDHKHYFCYALLPAIDENGNQTYTISLTYRIK